MVAGSDFVARVVVTKQTIILGDKSVSPPVGTAARFRGIPKRSGVSHRSWYQLRQKYQVPNFTVFSQGTEGFYPPPPELRFVKTACTMRWWKLT